MKKTQQNDLDFDMINLDETAGWNQLEVESALEKQEPEIEYFDEEEEYQDPVADTYMQAETVEYLDEEDEEAACAEEYVSGSEEAVFLEEEYPEEELLTDREVKKKTSSKGKNRKSKKKKPQTVWEKVVAAFQDMTALDGIIAVTGVMVLVVAIVTVSIFSGAKIAREQVAAFAPIGEEMEYLTDAGKGTLLAMADSKKVIEEEEEPTFEYEEKDLVVATINVNMKLTSVQKDLKIKFVNHKTGKLIPSVKFNVSVKDSEGTTKEYVDDDMDGIIYIKSMVPGNATVTMQAMSGEEGIAFNTAPQTIAIRDKIEYKKIDVSEEVKSESEVNAAVEDTAKEEDVEGALTDTVEWVASTKTEVGVEETYVEVDKSTIADPSQTAKAFLRMTQLIEETAELMDEEFVDVKSTDEEDDDSDNDEDSADDDVDESGDNSDEDGSEDDSSEDNDSEDEDTEEETSEQESTEESKDEESGNDDVKNDKVSLLKDKSGNQMYRINSKGEYVEAKYADYFKEDRVFYKKVESVTYKYTGWQNIDGKTYFYDKDGNYVTGEQVIQGAKYNFSSEGVLITGSGTMGIDVSKWNGTIDWNAVKNSGVSYVIIRCGYRGSTTGAMIEDPVFKSNIKGATAAGLKVGVYFFSQAVNEVEAVEEASMTIGLIRNYSISYPVFLDVEPSGGRADGIDKATRTKVIKAYCETIRNSGYTPGVYANKTWLESYMNAGELSSYKIWLAQYNTAPTYSGKVDLWQYTSKGKVAGISGHTDLNLSYLGY